MQILLLLGDGIKHFLFIIQDYPFHCCFGDAIRAADFYDSISSHSYCYMPTPLPIEQGVGDVFYFTDCFHSVTVSPMHQNKSMILHLNQEIPYQKATFPTKDAEDALKQMLTFLDSQEIGTEGCIALSQKGTLQFVGIQQAFDEETKNLIERGLPLPKVDAPFYLKEGSYSFIQMAPPSSIESLKVVYPILFEENEHIYLRLLKENPLTIIAQLWANS